MSKQKKDVSDDSEKPRDFAEEQSGSTPAQRGEAEATEAAPAANDPLSESSSRVSKGGKAERMRDFLKSQPKVRVLVPLAAGEKAGVTQSVILNGYSFYIRKGEYVEVPEAVAEVLEIKLKQKMALDNHPLRVGKEGGVKMDEFGGR